MKLRLHQFLSQTGAFTSKREAKEAVWAGRITVGNAIVKDISYQFNPQTKVVLLDDQLLQLPVRHQTFLLNKPAGVICSRLNLHEIELGKISVFDLFKGRLESTEIDRLHTVGRLDEQTTGMLLVTSDGDLAHRIISPNAGILKQYIVELTERMDNEAMQRLRDGVVIELEENGVVSLYPCKAESVVSQNERSIMIGLAEGKKRQVRRMVSAVGHAVISLHRQSIGGLSIASFHLKSGEFVQMQQSDIDAIFSQK